LLLKNYSLQTDFKSNEKNIFHIVVEPKNKYRPSLRCKFERESLVQRSCKHFNQDKQLDESFTFIDLTLNPAFDNQIFSLDTLKKIHSFDPKKDDTKPALKPGFTTMALKWLPLGFELVHTDVWDGNSGKTHHSVFSDGFARLSVYQRKLNENEVENLKSKSNENGNDTCVVNRFKQRGDWVYFRDMNDLRISAVGDISPKSVGKTLSNISDQ
jgi:negative regulator of sigma E activity